MNGVPLILNSIILDNIFHFLSSEQYHLSPRLLCNIQFPCKLQNPYNLLILSSETGLAGFLSMSTLEYS